MVDGVSTHVRTSARGSSAREVLARPVEHVLGVSTYAEQTLRQLGLETVFDLAVSTVFGQAEALLGAANGITVGLGRYGLPPGDVVDGSVKTTPIEELVLQGVSVLRAIGPQLGQRIEQTLDVNSVRELALW